MAQYKVLRAFRMPKTGGVYVPYRVYEAGVGLTSEDMAAWDLAPAQLAAEVLYLTSNGAIELQPAAKPAPGHPAPTAEQQAEITELEKAGLVVPAPAAS